VRLGELVRGLHPAPDVGAAAGVEVTGVAYDSRRVKAGDLFVAVVGTVSDGHAFAADAARRGARAVAVQAGWPAAREAAAAATAAGAAAFAVDDARRALALLSARFHGYPALRLRLIGITGTNGKTTSTYLVRAALRQAGRRAGLIGTVQNFVVDEPRPVEHTTPESADLQALLAEMVAGGAGAAVMEVSSHALAMGRVLGCPFAAALFTNLTPEHLDFHRDMDDYFATKAALFSGLGGSAGLEPGVVGLPFPPGAAAINADDPLSERLVALCPAPTLTFGWGPGAAVRGGELRLRADGCDFRVTTPAGAAPVALRLAGRYNATNALGALAISLLEGVALEDAIRGVGALTGVPGRLERVAGPPGVAGPPDAALPDVFVDYAHTPDALANALRAARELARGRLVVVFGCGGDRDRTKRPVMGELVARLADHAIVTSDNPRREDPLAIIAAIEAGIRGAAPGASYAVEPDRARAIAAAVTGAGAGDVVLVAGKGHETYQVFRDRTVHFDDREVAARALQERARALHERAGAG